MEIRPRKESILLTFLMSRDLTKWRQIDNGEDTPLTFDIDIDIWRQMEELMCVN